MRKLFIPVNISYKLGQFFFFTSFIRSEIVRKNVAMNNLRFIYLPNSSPYEVDIAAQDTGTGKILGQVQATAEKVKGYGREKLPQAYINSDTSTEFRKVAKAHMYVSDIFVEKEVRHQRIGEKLLAKIVQESERRGFKGRTMLVAYNAYETPPHLFYGKLGFISGDKNINAQIKAAIKTNSLLRDAKQTIMALSSGGIKRLLKSVR